MQPCEYIMNRLSVLFSYHNVIEQSAPSPFKWQPQRKCNCTHSQALSKWTQQQITSCQIDQFELVQMWVKFTVWSQLQNQRVVIIPNCHCFAKCWRFGGALIKWWRLVWYYTHHRMLQLSNNSPIVDVLVTQCNLYFVL